MAFENVNTVSLRNSINNCISSIDYSSSKQIINDITSNDVWSASSRDTLSLALQKLIDTRYKELENKLQSYLKIADKIEKYQQIANSISNAESLVTSLDSDLADARRLDLTYKSQGKENAEEAIKNRKKMEELTTKMNDSNSNITKNKAELASIKSSIENLL